MFLEVAAWGAALAQGRGARPSPWHRGHLPGLCARARARVCVGGALQPGRVSCPPVSAEQFASYWFAAVLSVFWISALS